MIKRQLVVCEVMLKDICAYWCEEIGRYEVSIFILQDEKNFSQVNSEKTEENTLKKWGFYASREEFNKVKKRFELLQRNHQDNDEFGCMALHSTLNFMSTTSENYSQMALLGKGMNWLFYDESESKVIPIDASIKEVFCHYIMSLR